jgi:non-heme chloroperoxidase
VSDAGRRANGARKPAAVKSAELLPKATLKVYPGFPHGMPTTNADVINADLLAFVRS